MHLAFIATLIFFPLLTLAQEPLRRVAVTFDDLPTVSVISNELQVQRAMTLRLLSSLSDRDIPAIGFVNESKLYNDGTLVPERTDLLRLWLAAGYELGNHSYSHPDLHRVSLKEFKNDVMRGDLVTKALLAERDAPIRYFRHPFLHTGRDLDTKQQFEAMLTKRHYRVAPVSIDNSEWIFARAYVNAIGSGDLDTAARIGTTYVDYMLNVFEYYEGQSQQLFDRNIAHVLLLHANALNADWFASLAEQLSAIGYEYIALDEALKDPAYASPDTYVGPGGIAWLHRWALTRKVDPAMFEGEPEAPQYILELSGL